MEQRATRSATDERHATEERHEFVADGDSAPELDAANVLKLLDDDLATDQPDNAVHGIANGILISAVLWIAALGAVLLFF